MQLIEITTIPFRYELQIENASFKKVETPEKNLDLSTKVDSSADTNVQKLRYDTVDFSNKSSFSENNPNYNNNHNGNMSGVYTKGDAQSTATKNYNKTNNTTSVNTENTANTIHSDYHVEVINSENNAVNAIEDKPEYEFNPPSVTLRVINMASVKIEYLAGPTYVPPSSDPDYEETE